MSDIKNNQFDYNKIFEDTRIKMTFVGNSKVGKTSIINSIMGNICSNYDCYEKTLSKKTYVANFNVVDSRFETSFIDKVKDLDLKTVELQLVD